MSILEIAIAILLLVLIAGGIYYFFVYLPEQKEETSTSATEEVVSTQKVVIPQNQVSVTKVVTPDSNEILFGESPDGTYVERNGEQMMCKRYPVEVIRV